MRCNVSIYIYRGIRDYIISKDNMIIDEEEEEER